MTTRITIPCGKCGACKGRNRAEWSFRIKEEFKASNTAYFLTLTYNNENIVYGNSEWATLVKRDLTLFIKALRQQNSLKNKNKIKYYAIGEYGTETFRPHYHIAIFNCDKELIESCIKIWKKGNIHIGEINNKSIHYITKYHINKNNEWLRNEIETIGIEPEFTFISKGMGINYVKENKKWHKQGGKMYVKNNGYNQSMPKYYKDKIFTNKLERYNIQLKTIPESDKAYLKEIKRLEKLGYTNAGVEIEYREFIQAKKIIDKAKNNNKF